MLATVWKEIVVAYFKVHLRETEIHHVNSIRIAGFRNKIRVKLQFQLRNFKLRTTKVLRAVSATVISNPV
jgi:hypothetical protein